METEQIECDQEIRGIIGKDNLDVIDDLEARKPEPEIQHAAQVKTEQVAEVCSKKEDGTFQKSSGEQLPAAGNKGNTPPEIRTKLEGFSNQSSRKGSSCSTPISSSGRGEIDYPSPNFVRGASRHLEENCQSVFIDEGQRLSIRLHYNPVMDEWVSLTDESVLPATLNTQDLDTLFDLHKKIGCFDANETEVIHIGQFLLALEKTGIRRTDPRLKIMMTNLNSIKKEHYPDTPIESLNLNRNEFKRAVRDDIQLLSRAFKNQFAIPEFDYFSKQVTNLYNICKENKSGEVASYIPQLARYDPNYWGVSICTVDGQRFSIGDTRVPFTMQSSSKPFSYAVCLNELGSELVHQYVGQEPSGRMFNELSLDSNNKPHNPLLNSGAIMSAALQLSLVNPDMKMSEKFEFLSEYIKRIAGGEFLGFNNSIFLSERETADRNYALAYYMKENKCFPKGFALQDCLDFYFQTCSMEVNCESISIMGATLANGGVCPITNDEVLKPASVRDVLSLMHSCGMYNYSGEYAFNVGLPAKSGVSGALVLVVPNVMGIGLFSPPLDSLGNTCRGVQFSKELVKFFKLHRFDNLMRTNLMKVDPRLFKDEHSRQTTLSLLYSATTGDLTALKRFNSNKVNINVSNYDGRTPLHLACAEGHLSCVKFLTQTCKLDPLQKDRWGFTPLIEAKRFRHEKVVEFLLQLLDKQVDLDDKEN